MTYEEALKHLENIDLYLARKTGKLINKDFVNTLKKALEKQIPKKLTLSKDVEKSWFLEPFSLYGRVLHCPTCNNIVFSYNVERQDYCSKCGQKIDWSV